MLNSCGWCGNFNKDLKQVLFTKGDWKGDKLWICERCREGDLLKGYFEEVREEVKRWR